MFVTEDSTMKNFIHLPFLICALTIAESTRYTPDWPSLDSRPLPDWYDKAKIGIFMHFGPYAVPSYVDAWFWYDWREKQPNVVKFMEDNYRPDFTYQDFGSQLTMEFFNPTQFAELVKASGAKYFVFTSKHLDGFTNFKSPYTFGWNSVDVGPKRDVVGELKAAFEKYPDMHFGLYYCFWEPFNPLYIKDMANNYTTQEYVNNKIMPEAKYLVEKYKPEIFWADGAWLASPDYWKSKEFLAWLYNDSPTKDTLVTNDRWGIGTQLKHGGFYSGPDKFNPGHLLQHKFEDAFTIDLNSWGYRRIINIADVIKIEDLIAEIVTVVSCNGNALVNVGPTKEGTIIPIFQERLHQMGDWLRRNGEAIYDTRPWTHQNDSLSKIPQVWYTSKDTTVYGIALGWPDNNILTIGDVKTSTTSQINLIGWPKPLKFAQSATGVQIRFPEYSQYLKSCGQTCQVGQGFTLKFTNLSNAIV